MDLRADGPSGRLTVGPESALRARGQSTFAWVPRRGWERAVRERTRSPWVGLGSFL